MATKTENEKLIEATVKHKTANFLTEFRMEFTEHKTELALFRQKQEYMDEKIDKNHKEVMLAVTQIKTSLETLPEKFATKDEHRQNRESIDRVWRIIWWVITFVFTALFGMIGAVLIWFIKNS